MVHAVGLPVCLVLQVLVCRRKVLVPRTARVRRRGGTSASSAQPRRRPPGVTRQLTHQDLPEYQEDSWERRNISTVLACVVFMYAESPQTIQMRSTRSRARSNSAFPRGDACLLPPRMDDSDLCSGEKFTLMVLLRRYVWKKVKMTEVGFEPTPFRTRLDK